MPLSISPVLSKHRKGSHNESYPVKWGILTKEAFDTHHL